MSFAKQIKVGNKVIAEDQPVFIIAEAGVNHNGDVELGKKLIDSAKEAGADAVKFQTFKAENLNTKTAPKSTYHIETTGNEQSWYDLLKTQELDRSMHEAFIDYCRQKDIIFLSTPYDEESADLLDDLNVPLFKIASTDANNIPFLKYLAAKNRPIILSTAMCTLDEVRESVEAIKKTGLKELALLHCTANYPAQLSDTNLRAMLTLKKEFDILVGYSDHSLEIINPIAATAMGACIYEKHITLDKKLPGPDHRCSLEPDELKQLVLDIRQTESALGSSQKRLLAAEEENVLKLRKSIIAKTDIEPGQTLTGEMLTIKRPATGFAPKHLNRMIGAKAKAAIAKDSVIAEDMVDLG